MRRPPAGRADVTSFGEHAAENLQFIRRAMETSSTFTAVPGAGGVLMGLVGITAAVLAARQPTPGRWLAVWLGAALAGASCGAFFMHRKAARVGAPLAGRLGRRFAVSLAAPLVAGAALTAALAQRQLWGLMPPVWLLLYGTGVLTGGTFSIAPVRLLGLVFMAAGLAALATPPSWGDVWLGLAFGGLQIAFGVYIARKHGG